VSLLRPPKMSTLPLGKSVTLGSRRQHCQVARGAEALNAEGNRRREYRGVGGDTNHGGVAVPPRLLEIPENAARPLESVTAESLPESAASGHALFPKLGGKLDARNGCVVRIE